eukprot:COSAG05_NODE_265_length_12666_cov_104.645739_12_plen_49_part_00
MGRCDEAAAPAQVNVRVAGWALFACPRLTSSFFFFSCMKFYNFTRLAL